jgi:hypothetical protein
MLTGERHVQLRLASMHPLAALGAAFLVSMCTLAGSEQGAADSRPDAAVHGDAAPVEIRCVSSSDCPIPSSTCDAYGVVFYTEPRCTAGSCVWTRNTVSCPCSNGGCYNTSTTSGVGNLPPAACVQPTCSGCVDCRQDCECRSGDATACAAQCSEAGADSGDAADVAECTEQDLSGCHPPPSQCIDGSTLRYFDNASCVDGRCAWQQKSLNCTCAGGGCQSTTTAGGVGGSWSDSG